MKKTILENLKAMNNNVVVKGFRSCSAETRLNDSKHLELFISYSTPILIININTHEVVACRLNYSTTTSCQITKYLHTYGLNKHDITMISLDEFKARCKNDFAIVNFGRLC